MLCDHVGHALFPQYMILRLIGRISFPIFAYVLVEGFFYTRDVKKFLMRLGALAIISEIPFDMMASQKILEFGHQNVFFTLFLSVLAMYFMAKTINPILQLIIAGASMFLANLVQSDYRYVGVLIVLWFYCWRNKAWIKYLGFILICLLFFGTIGIFTSIAIIPIFLHSGKQGPKCKWLFYFFYPAHLLVIGMISIYL